MSEHQSDTLIFEGDEPLKSLEIKGGKARVGAYAIRFSDASEKDLTGEYFTAKTDFGAHCGDGATTMFNHGNAPTKALEAVCERTFSPVKTRRDEIGIFAEAVLDLSNEYEKAIADLCAQGKLKWSSGTAAHLMRKSADGEIVRWHPIEFSYTPTPAEPRLPAIRPMKSVELGASDAAEIEAAFASAQTQRVDTPEGNKTQTLSTKATTMTVTEPTPEQKAAELKAVNDAVAKRIGEVNEINSLGERYNCREAASQFALSGKSADEFRKHILGDVLKAAPVEVTPVIGMDRKDVKRWSMLKAMRDLANGRPLSGIEKEASDATAKRIGREAKGFFIPHDVAAAHIADSHDLNAYAMKALADSVKNLSQSVFGSGGALVGTNLLTDSLIELLRNKPLVSMMGARTLSGLVGNIALPSMNGGATAYWLSESGTATNSDQSFGQLGLTPKRLVGRTGYTKELLNQTDLSVEALVRDDITTVLGLAKDLAALNGSGGAQPLGILNTTGINTVTFGATATRQKATDFQKEVAVDNASRGALAYMTTPTTAGKWMNVQEATNYPKFLWDGNIDQGNVVGRPAYSTNQVPSDKVIYGNWNDLILADWAGMDVVVNPYTNDATGVVTITITLWSDIAVRHAVSFCVSTDSGAQ